MIFFLIWRSLEKFMIFEILFKCGKDEKKLIFIKHFLLIL